MIVDASLGLILAPGIYAASLVAAGAENKEIVFR